MVAGEKAEGDTVCPCNSERKDHGRSVWGSSSLIIGDACRSSEFPFGEIGDLDFVPSISSAVFADPSAPDGLCSSSALRRRTTKKMARPISAKITEATPTMPTMAPVLRFEESSVEEAVVGLGGTADGVDVEEPVPAVKVAWELAESREVIVWTEVVLGWWYTKDGSDTSQLRLLSSRCEGSLTTLGMMLAVKVWKAAETSVLGQTLSLSHLAGGFVM